MPTFHRHAPRNAPFVTVGASSPLTAERALTGTSNQVTVTDGGANGAVTLSAPQNLHTGATPQFAKLGINGANSASYFFEVYATTTGSGAKVTATAAPASNSGGGMALEISGAHPTAAGHRLGGFFFGSDDDVYKVSSCGVFAFSEEAFSQSTAYGSNLRFETTNIGSTSRAERLRVSAAGRVGIGVTGPTAMLHLKAGTATASTAPLKLNTGTVLTTAEAGAVEYNNTFHLTDSDATRRHVVVCASSTKTTAGAPYTNDGYITVRIGGTDVKLMTTA